jgi:hypothetical protein
MLVRWTKKCVVFRYFLFPELLPDGTGGPILVAEMLADMDANDDGGVDFQEFVAVHEDQHDKKEDQHESQRVERADPYAHHGGQHQPEEDEDDDETNPELAALRKQFSVILDTDKDGASHVLTAAMAS